MTRRLFVLLEWHPALGMAALPVGVLGLEDEQTVVSWVPALSITTVTWARRLTTSPGPPAIEAWLDQDGTARLEEVPPPAGAVTLADAVEIILDSLLAEVLPRLPEAR